MIGVSINFSNGTAEITMTSKKKLDVDLLRAAFNDRTLTRIQAVEEGFKLVLESQNPATPSEREA